MIQVERVILKLIGYGEEGWHNDIVAKDHSKGTARWLITATHHSQGTAWWPITATHHSQWTVAASAVSATHAPGAGAAHPAGGVAPAGGVQRSISPQVLTKAWRPPLHTVPPVVFSLPWWYKYLRYPLWPRAEEGGFQERKQLAPEYNPPYCSWQQWPQVDNAWKDSQ